MQHTVNHGCRLGSGNVLVRLKGAVCIALNPTQRSRTSDFLFRPVSRDIVKITLYLDIALVETRANCRKFRSCDGCIRHKGIRCASLQNTNIRHCGNGFIMPQSKRHIVKSILCRKVTVTHIVLQQTEEDSRNLGSADIRIRSDCSILIANDICKVIITIQGFGNIRCLPARINGFITRHFNFCDFIR